MTSTKYSAIHINADGTFTPANVPFASATLAGVNIGDLVEEYYITTEDHLTAGCVFGATSAPYVGLKFKFIYYGTIATPNGHTVSFFGTILTSDQLSQKLNIECTYGVNGAAWFVSVEEAQPLSADVPGADVKTLLAAGETITLVPGTDHINQILNGTFSPLLAGINVTAAGGAAGNRFIISYEAKIADLNGSTVTIFGYTLSQAEAATGALTFIVNWDTVNYVWNRQVIPGTPNFQTNRVGTTNTTLVNGGGTITLLSGVDTQGQNFIGTPTLAASYVITGTAVRDGDTFYVFYNANTIVGVNTITIFDYQLTTAEALAGGLYITAMWDGGLSSWIIGKSNQACTGDCLPLGYSGDVGSLALDGTNQDVIDVTGIPKGTYQLSFAATYVPGASEAQTIIYSIYDVTTSIVLNQATFKRTTVTANCHTLVVLAPLTVFAGTTHIRINAQLTVGTLGSIVNGVLNIIQQHA